MAESMRVSTRVLARTIGKVISFFWGQGAPLVGYKPRAADGSHDTTRGGESHLRIKIYRGKQSQEMARGRFLTAFGHVDPAMPEEIYTLTFQFLLNHTSLTELHLCHSQRNVIH